MAEKRVKEARVFTDLTEIFEHNTKESLWMLINNKVYDVTNFKHPGGKQILLQNAGQDATTQFEDISHSSKADKFMEELYIGDFKPENDDDTGKEGILQQAEKGDSGDLTSRVMLALVFLAVIGLLYTQVVA